MARAERVGAIDSYCRNYTKRISNNIAAALVVYTLLLIFISIPAIDAGASMWPFMFLALLVAGIIPLFRKIDRRWRALASGKVIGVDLERLFFVDRIKLWGLALLIPAGLTLFCKISSFAM